MNDPHIWWYVTRASAVIAWILLTLSVIWGILLSTRLLRNIDNPGWLQDLHKYFGGASLVMVALHVASLMLDGWLHFSLGQHDDGTLRLTGIKAWRWIGTEKQLRAVRAKFPETKGFERIKLAPKPINPKL